MTDLRGPKLHDPGDLHSRVRETEEIAADAVPAAVVEQLDGWRLRFNHGFKRRPNSVLANQNGGALDTETKIARAEAFYAAHGLRARFQLSPASLPADLDARLEARGYVRAGEPVCVQVAALSKLGVLRPVAGEVTLLEHPTEAWFALLTEIEGTFGIKAAALRDMLGKLPGRPVFALASDAAGLPAATAVGVDHGGSLGIFNVATHPQARRQGLATALTAQLCRWGEQRGLSGAYLQVAANNTRARSLYEQLGFTTLYNYFYREQV